MLRSAGAWSAWAHSRSPRVSIAVDQCQAVNGDTVVAPAVDLVDIWPGGDLEVLAWREGLSAILGRIGKVDTAKGFDTLPDASRNHTYNLDTILGPSSGACWK